MKLMLDSSALIEYYLGTEQGEKVRGLIKESEIVFVPNIVFAETISKLIRSGLNPEPVISVLNQYAVPLEIPEYFVEAGKRHALLRKTVPNISLIDVILLVLSEKSEAKIVTKDKHLAGKNTLLLE